MYSKSGLDQLSILKVISHIQPNTLVLNGFWIKTDQSFDSFLIESVLK